MSKPKVITEFEKLEQDLQERIKLNYPLGFEKHLITFKNKKKHLISALPYEAEERFYLVKMSREKAHSIIMNDDDYNDNGMLKSDVMAAYEDKFAALVDEKLAPEADVAEKK